MNDYLRVLRYFFVGFILASIVSFFFLLFFVKIQLSFIIASILGCIYGLFCVGFMVRTLKVVEFDITTQNKAKDRGFPWYKEQIEDQMLHMPFERIQLSEKVIYKPRRLYKVYESPVEVTYEPYLIHLKASRVMMRVLLDILDLKLEVQND